MILASCFNDFSIYFSVRFLDDFWSDFAAILGAKTDLKRRSKMEVDIGGDFGRLWEAQMEPNEDFGRIWGSFWGHVGIIFGFKNENFRDVFWNEIWIPFWMDFGRILEVILVVFWSLKRFKTEVANIWKTYVFV